MGSESRRVEPPRGEQLVVPGSGVESRPVGAAPGLPCVGEPLGVFRFALDIEPVPWARAGAAGVRRFTPKRVAEYEHAIRLVARAARPRSWPMGARYALDVYATRSTWRRCDVDNLAKAVMDALNGAVWDDDDQVDRLLVERVRGAPRGRLEVEVRAYVAPLPEPRRRRRGKLEAPRGRSGGRK